LTLPLYNLTKRLGWSVGLCGSAAGGAGGLRGVRVMRGYKFSPIAAVASALALAGCAGGIGSFGGFGGGAPPPPDPATVQPLPAPEIPASIRSSEVVGRWGFASFHDPKDRARTETNARNQ